MSKWETKSIYQSTLVREGRTMVKLKGDPIDSKYRKGEKVVGLQVPDDDKVYWLTIEPEVLASIEAAPKDRWLMVQATGGKDVKPSLIFADDAGPIPTQDDYVAPEGDGPPPMWPEDAPSAPKANGHAQAGNGLMARCWGDAVALVRADFPNASPDAAVEAASRVANTLFIQASRS